VRKTLAAVAALIWLAVLVDRRLAPSTSDITAEARHPIPLRDLGGSILIERGPNRIALELRHDAPWIVSGAVPVRADDAAFAALRGALEFGVVARRVPLEAAQKLATPRAVFTIGGHRLALGADDPSGRLVYAQLDGAGEALLVEHRILELALGEWRSPRLTVDHIADSRRLEVGPLVVEGRRIVAPRPGRADPIALAAMWSVLERARARRFLDATNPAAGTPITVDDRRQSTLLAECPDHPSEREVVRADGVRLCFDAADLAPLTITPEALRESRWFPVNLDSIREVTISDGDTLRLQLRRANGRWRLQAGTLSADGDDDAIRAWLRRLLTRRGEPPKSSLTITLVGDDIVTAPVEKSDVPSLQSVRSQQR
jgi:hypothetical protein